MDRALRDAKTLHVLLLASAGCVIATLLLAAFGYGGAS
jgi:hypothetical protein